MSAVRRRHAVGTGGGTGWSASRASIRRRLACACPGLPPGLSVAPDAAVPSSRRSSSAATGDPDRVRARQWSTCAAAARKSLFCAELDVEPAFDAGAVELGEVAAGEVVGDVGRGEEECRIAEPHWDGPAGALAREGRGGQ